MNKLNKLVASFVVVLIVGTVGLANASVILDFTTSEGSASDTAGVRFTLGWTFTLSQALTFNSLGIWDEVGDGLTESHQIGLWKGDGTLVDSATVPGGKSGTYVASASGLGGWRFAAITPLTLQPGTYVVGADYINSNPLASDTFRESMSHRLMATGATYVTGNLAQDTTNLQFPNIDAATVGFYDGIFGANIGNLGPTAVPEPSTYALLCISLGVVGYARRRMAKGLKAKGERLMEE